MKFVMTVLEAPDEWPCVVNVVQADVDHWWRGRRLQNEINQWLDSTGIAYRNSSWRWEFKTVEDAEWFQLRWS
jgi:hypothetical protein